MKIFSTADKELVNFLMDNGINPIHTGEAFNGLFQYEETKELLDSVDFYYYDLFSAIERACGYDLDSEYTSVYEEDYDCDRVYAHEDIDNHECIDNHEGIDDCEKETRPNYNFSVRVSSPVEDVIVKSYFYDPDVPSFYMAFEVDGHTLEIRNDCCVCQPNAYTLDGKYIGMIHDDTEEAELIYHLEERCTAARRNAEDFWDECVY